MNYRHEWKHEINYEDLLILRSRLSAVMKRDPHAAGSAYRVRSLYFDNMFDQALREKIDGVNRREKFRIRFYNGDTSFVVLEKKSKINGLCAKESCRITKEEAARIVCGDVGWMRECEGLNAKAVPCGDCGDIGWMRECERLLCFELYRKMQTRGLRPKTIVEYTREPFVFGPGNVRVTIDYNIRTGLFCDDFLNPETLTLPAGDSPILLEVKWDEFLPAIVQDAVSLPGRRASAFSKYEQCRIYG